MASGQFVESGELRGEAWAQLRDSGGEHQQLRAQLERALRVERVEFLHQRRERVGCDLG